MVGNRGFFPGHLAESGRAEMIAALEQAGHSAVALRSDDARHGAVESRAEAAACADLFRKHADKIDGIIVTLPNFGDERAIADTLRTAGLPVPVLIQATPDTPGRMTIADRRDSFCGKMSACNNLTQYGIPYSLTTRHTEAPDSDLFRQDLAWFAAVCRVVRGLRRLRIGAIGARPAAFNTVRYSEKILENNGISVEPIDLSEIFGRIAKMADDDPAAVAKLAAIRKLRVHRRRALWRPSQDGQAGRGDRPLDGADRSGHQRGTVLDLDRRVFRRGALHGDEHDEREPHVERLRGGYLRRHRHARAATGFRNAQRPARLEQQLRRRSRQGRVLPLQQPPKHFFREARMDFQQIIAGTVGRENTYGTCEGLVKPSPMSFARFSTDDSHGTIRGYVGEGRLHGRSADNFRRRGRSGDPRSARAAALHLRARLRAPRGGQPGPGVGGRTRSRHAVSGMERT